MILENLLSENRGDVPINNGKRNIGRTNFVYFSDSKMFFEKGRYRSDKIKTDENKKIVGFLKKTWSLDNKFG